MKKIILLIAVFVSVFAQGMKADEYTQIIERLARAGVLATSGNTAQFDQLKTVSPKLAEYMNGQMITDIAELTAPYYRDNCTVEELKQYEAYMTSPEMIELAKKMASSSVQDNSLDKNEISQAIQSLMMGGQAPDIKPLECSKEMAEAVENLCRVNNVDKLAEGNGKSMIETMKKTISSMMSRMGGQNNSDVDAMMSQMEAPLKAMGEYIGKNMPVIVRNMIKTNFSIEDINQLTKIEKEPFYPAVNRANEAMYDDMSNFTSKLMELMLPKVEEAMSGMMPSLH